MRINHNSLALNASDHYATINANIAKSMARLSSGTKITSPADDAAGLAISTKMNSQIRNLDRASLNSNDGISVIQTAEGGMEEIHSILARMRELAVQAANDVYSEEDRDAIQEEINSLKEELDQIAETTAFNGQKLLDGSLTRRSLSSDPNLKATYISDDVEKGKYEIKVTADGKQAITTIGLTNSAATITKEQAGNIKVNGFTVDITEGMTMTEVYETLQNHLSKIGIDVISSVDGGENLSNFGTGSVMFRTKQYGSDQEIRIQVTNPELDALFGYIDGTEEKGEDCVASIEYAAPGDEGFSQTATCSTKGNEITIIDRNGFEMKLDVEPDAVKKGGAIDSVVEVLSAGVMVIQTGGNSGEQIELDIPAVNAKGLKVDNLIMYTHELASEAVKAIDAAITKVSNARSTLGAYENRLEDIYDNLEIQNESLTAAYSRLMDTDMAEEMTEYTQQNVLAQAAVSMMQKSNERPETILQLLQ